MRFPRVVSSFLSPASWQSTPLTAYAPQRLLYHERDRPAGEGEQRARRRAPLPPGQARMGASGDGHGAGMSSYMRIYSALRVVYDCCQDELASCFIYQVGALTGFLRLHGVQLNHVSLPLVTSSRETARIVVMSFAIRSSRTERSMV